MANRAMSLLQFWLIGDKSQVFNRIYSILWAFQEPWLIDETRIADKWNNNQINEKSK